MIICKKCGSIATYNSYFDAYICGNCHAKNHPYTEKTTATYEKKKIRHPSKRKSISKPKFRLSYQR
jgi:hypothetical protein